MFRGVSECSGMFRNVPGCSVFRVLSTPNNSVALLISCCKSEWHENLMGFIGQHARFCCTHAKAKITEFGDQQASKISVRTKYFFVRCTRATNLEPWKP